MWTWLENATLVNLFEFNCPSKGLMNIGLKMVRSALWKVIGMVLGLAETALDEYGHPADPIEAYVRLQKSFASHGWSSLHLCD